MHDYRKNFIKIFGGRRGGEKTLKYLELYD